MSKRITPLGEPAEWTRDDLARMSRVSDADKVEARQYWRERAPRTLPQAGGEPVNGKELIDATPRRKRKGGAP